MNYIINMLAKPNKVTTSQTNAKSVDDAMDLYLKDSYICFYSFLKHNKDVQPLLFVNFELPKKWNDLFSNCNVKVVFVPFGCYQIADTFSWSIVQYRYDVVQYLCSNLQQEDKILMLDTDVVCVDSCEELFDEMNDNILFFDVQHRMNARDRLSIINNFKTLYPQNQSFNLIHRGGEMIASKINYLKIYLNKCAEISNLSKKFDNLTNFNDEHITSIALSLLKRELPISNANAYIFRYWTKNDFYLVSTNYLNNPVCLWHLPNEKDSGLFMVFDYILKHNEMPSNKLMAKWFGFCKVKRVNCFRQIFYKIMRKIKLKRRINY